MRRVPSRDLPEPYPICSPELETVLEHEHSNGASRRSSDPFHNHQLEMALHEHTRAQARRQLEKSLKRNALSHEGLEYFLALQSRTRAQRQVEAEGLPPRVASHNDLPAETHELVSSGRAPAQNGLPSYQDSIRRNQSTMW